MKADLQTLQNRVRAGAQFLDQNAVSDWRERLSSAKLDVSSTMNCPLGQIYGYYNTGLKRLSITAEQAALYGFADFNCQHDELTTIWQLYLNDPQLSENEVQPQPAPKTDADFDELIRKYSGELQSIYDNRTAGDHTFVGVLYHLLREATE